VGVIMEVNEVFEKVKVFLRRISIDLKKYYEAKLEKDLESTP
jgi:hypothetical protein